MQVFQIYDVKAEAFLPPFFLKTVGLAVRTFEAAANEKDHNFYLYGADFTLFHTGEYDETSGRVKQFEAFKNLGTALSYRDATAMYQDAPVDALDRV